MHIISYNNNHLKFIHEWLKARNMPLPSKTEMPEIGYVVYEKKTPIAAAFIRKVEGGLGQLDGLVSNPSQPSDIRDDAIEAVIHVIMNKAKSLGITKIFAFSSDKNTLLRSKRFGFKDLPQYSLIAADLSEQNTGDLN